MKLQKKIGLAIKVHKILNLILLESAYKERLFFKLLQSDWVVEKDKPMPLVFEDVKLDCGYKIDFLIVKKLIIEIKSAETLKDIH